MSLFILATLAAFFIKGLCGFANTLVFQSILSFGVNNASISPVELALGFPGNAILTWQNRKSLDPKVFGPLMALMLAGNIPGALMLSSIDGRIVKIIFKVAHQKSYFYTSAFSSIIHHLMILRTNQPCCFRRSKAASHKARLWALPYSFILIFFLQSTTESVPFGLPSHQPSPVRNITSN